MMSGIRSKDTKPELFVRRALHAQGFRYRLGGAGLAGRPDLVFPSRKVVVFIHGCFWHRHECRFFKWPANTRDFWGQKINQNAERDSRNLSALEAMGWRVFVMWECELKATGYKLPNPVIEHFSCILKKSN
jgi:DNA mismatch endonuclease (patch repair protein)